MPLRKFPIGPVGEEVYPRFVAALAARFDDPAQDRNVVAREALAMLYLGERVDFDEGGWSWVEARCSDTVRRVERPHTHEPHAGHAAVLRKCSAR